MKTFFQTLSIAVLICASIFVSAQMPVLSSHPASSAVLLLDFDGTIVEGTSWNGSGPIACAGSNLTPSQIRDVFNRVAEDYRPFTINVTTDSSVFLAAPSNKRTRVILTTSSSWYGSAGGVAYINSYSWGDNTPCFVFTALLGYNTKSIAEATSHELGHTLGLRHQSSYDAFCNKVSEYNSGNGSGEIGWAPIMGVSYYRNMTLWNYGANPFGCTSYQDDLSVITSKNGIGYRNDDHAATNSGASPASFISNTFTVEGLIEKPADTDAFKFTMAADGRFTLDALPYAIASGNTGSNIDLAVDLLNTAETVIGTYNPATTLGASIDTQLTAGVYYIRVRGEGNSYAPNYASLGSYTLHSSFSTGNPLPLYLLQLKGANDKGHHSLSWQIITDEKIVSQTLEAATDGTRFHTIAAINAQGKTYSYIPTTTHLLYYRLRVVLTNGRNFYSNTIALRNNDGNNKPYIIGNTINTNIIVSSPSTFHYAIHDLSGRTVGKGSLTPGVNTIAAGVVARGIYVIQYYNGNELYSEKFTRQ
ncbi:MAG TPA: zinc-dependent metalloprotease [Flavisolibacter sp.]|jgi:hypothetical protein|nr:zinc-dependent metalloprotease [Flavisolibacter sp.]